MTHPSAPRRLRVFALAVGLIGLGAGPATAAFSSYHAFFVYADDGANTATFEADAKAMQTFFDGFTTDWETSVYGVNEGAGFMDLNDALAAMSDPSVAAPDEFIFFYYSGHGGGTDGTSGQAQPGSGVADADGDESDVEDPPPAPMYNTDTTDETLAYDLVNNRSMTDDELGTEFLNIQGLGATISGAIDSCYSNGILDGSADVRGLAGLESAWMTSATEWEPAPIACGSGFGTIVDRLGRVLPMDISDVAGLTDWFLAGAAFGGAGSTIGVKTYDIDGVGNKLYFPTLIPEPSSVLATALGLPLLLLASRRGVGRAARRSA